MDRAGQTQLEWLAMKHLLFAFLTLALCTLPAGAAKNAAPDAVRTFITVESQSGEVLTAGLGTLPGHEDEVLVQAVSFGLDGDYDPATGSATGRPTPQPVGIIKSLDALTPLLLTQMANNASLQVQCSILAVDPAGREQRIFTLALEDARLVGINAAVPAEGDAPDRHESLKFVYRVLTVTDERSGISATLHWAPPVD
jgi:type VI secretion system Hcp family effector